MTKTPNKAVDEAAEATAPTEAALAAEAGSAADPDPTAEQQAGGAADPYAANDPEILSQLAALIDSMLVWRRAELLAILLDHEGMAMEYTLGGVTVSMQAIMARSDMMGPAGVHQALENWANAARRQVLELRAAVPA